MKILLIGPVPPPHGGISVHVLAAARRLQSEGAEAVVLDPSRYARRSGFLRDLWRQAPGAGAMHLHTNGHNPKSWLLALLSAIAAWRVAGPRTLTLHSGMAPGFLRVSAGHRWLARCACRLYDRIDCVNPAIRRSIVALGVPPAKTAIAPAHSVDAWRNVALEASLDGWMGAHRPLLSATLFFRPEYGFNVLLDAVARLGQEWPSLGCVVMGSGEQKEEALRQIRLANLEDRIKLMGDVEHDLCMTLIARSDIFARPTFEDGDSISVREALSLGVRVVASRAGARPQGVVLFEPGDAGGLASAIEAVLAESFCGPAAGNKHV